MKINKILGLLLLPFLLSSCNDNKKNANKETLINGNISEIVELNDLYNNSTEEEKERCFITLIYEKDSIYSNYFIVDKDVDIMSYDEIEVDACSLIHYDKTNIISKNSIISEEDLIDGDVLILYTINDDISSLYPVQLSVDKLYKLEINSNIKLNYDKYLRYNGLL